MKVGFMELQMLEKLKKMEYCLIQVEILTNIRILLTRLKNIKSPKIENGLYKIYDKGIDYTQIRDVAWYWGYQD